LNNKKIFGLVRESPLICEIKAKHSTNQPIKLLKKRRRDGNFNTGRWRPDEHRRFIEALLKFGNDWKSIQKYVGTRTSTQARSHAQKFFVKLGKTKIQNLSVDFINKSLRSLNEMSNHFDDEELANTIQLLNQMTYAKKERPKENKFKDDDDLFVEFEELTLPTMNDLSQRYSIFNIEKESDEKEESVKKV
jgi:SHAQKYF class myb-like DNA-binding protein